MNPNNSDIQKHSNSNYKIDKSPSLSDGKGMELVEVTNGKYLVKFPFLDVPVEMSESYYNSIIEAKD